MAIKAAEFVTLVRKMRAAQKHYRMLNEKTDTERKLNALLAMNELQKMVDHADVEDPANLETDFPQPTEV